MAGKEIGDIFRHAPALRFMDRFRRRTDENDAHLIVAVFVVIADLNFRSHFGKRAQRPDSRLRSSSETTSYVAAPTDIEDSAARVEKYSRLIVMHTLGFI